MQNPEEIKTQLPALAPEEFEDLVINPVLPKKKKALKVQQPQELTVILSDILNRTQKLFLNISTTTSVAEKYFSNPDFVQSIIDLLNSLYMILIHYKQILNKDNGMPLEMLLVFENNTFAKLDKLTSDISEKYIYFYSDNHQLYSELIKIELRLHLFCHNHTCFIKEEELAHYNRIEFVMDCYLGLALMFLRMGQLLDAEYYALKEKKLIDLYRGSEIATKWIYLAGYYSSIANIYYQKEDYAFARECALKANSFTAKLAEKGLHFDLNVYKIYMGFMQLAYKSSRSNEALFWAKIALAHCQNVNLFIHKTDIQLKDSVKKEFEEKVKSIKSLIQIYKNKLIQQKHEELKLTLEGYPLSLSNIQSFLSLIDKPTLTTSINVHTDNELSYLLNLLRRLNIVCQYDVNASSITIFNLIHINVSFIKNALENWTNYIATKSSKQKVITNDNALSPSVLMPPTTASDSFLKDQISITTETDTQKVPIIKRKNMPSNDSEISTSYQRTSKHNKITSWGENYPTYFRGSNTVFKLRGDLKRHYLTIKPELLADISQQNPMAAKNLLQICDRGKQLGDSKGDKGILVTGDKAKAKDSSKSYRFFGRVVATTTDEKGKIRTLIEFNGWTENHKQKAPEIVTERSWQKFKAKPG